MKHALYILLTLLFSCKDKNNNDFAEENILNNNYKQIVINCQGTDASSRCENKEKEIAFTNLINNGKTVIDFKYKDQNYIHSLNEQITDLGLKSYLFENDKKMILILDSFLEYGHKFYTYFIEENKIKYIGSNEFAFQFDENEIELKYNFIISEKENLINLNLGSSYENINLNNAIVLPLNDTNSSEYKNSIDVSGSWKLECNSELLTFDISKNKVYLFLNSDNSIYINILLKEVKGKDDEYTLHFFNTESQNEFYEDIGNVKDKEISKDQSIAKISFTDNNTMLLNWIGLYNIKTNKLQFVEDFIFLKENNNVNPITLKKCD
ncbi:hypothetical protein [Flavobacterium piscis]|uniref:F5/8 type C domain-containing protein n=1 Tax=Flavobacterium piscis TaxID=1114874 RepID=A0ABU1YCW7_9FLAO|nr:hypothetical protein [Flavobacterium piscis]MDR7211465.1 hypothetical protein [Flavobacterium piscis]